VPNKDKIIEDQPDINHPEQNQTKIYDGSSDRDKTDQVKKDINNSPK
jgi:hypothetical protein